MQYVRHSANENRIVEIPVSIVDKEVRIIYLINAIRTFAEKYGRNHFTN